MKSYFTKYLPVEGEIDYDDYWLHPDGTIIQAKGEVHYKNAKKVKLFLCSRDIHVDDKVFGNIESSEEYTFYKDMDKSLCFKIIGEISDQATWVKEGDEFDEDQCGYPEYEYDGVCNTIPLKNGPVKGYEKEPSWNHIMIKGPCGHFH